MSKSYGNPQQTALAYIAGIIDGEGCLRIVKAMPYREDMVNPSYSPSIQVGMKNREVLEFCKQYFGGSIYKERTRYWVYRWRINSKRQVINCLKKILPWLIVKKEEAEVLLDFCKKVKPWFKGGKPMTDNELAFREDFYQKMKELKKCEVAASTERKDLETENDSQNSDGNTERAE